MASETKNRKSTKNPKENVKPTISIIITLYNDWRVKDTIDSLIQQDLHADEILVADAGSEKKLLDMIYAYEKKHQSIKILNIPGSIAESRNKTLPKATGDLIIFIDSDEKAPTPWLKEIIKPIIEKKADFVGGKTIPMYPPKNKVEKYIYDSSDWLYENVFTDDPSMIHMGNSAWRKEIFETIGNFDARLQWGGEDYDINIRAMQAGFKGLFSNEAWVWHDRGMDSLSKIFKKKYKYNIGTTIAYLKNKEFNKKSKNALKIGYKHPIELFSYLIKILSFIRGYRIWKLKFKEK